MQQWQQFLRFEYSDEIMLVVGGLLVLIGVLQIVRSSLKLLFWVLLAGVGAVSASYGMQRSPYDLPALDQFGLTEIRDMVPTLSNDVLEILCQKLESGNAQ